MVFASTCEHASSAFIFANTSSNQICFASSKHFKTEIHMASSEHFVNCLAESGSLFIERNVLRQVIWLTLFNQSQQFTANCAL